MKRISCEMKASRYNFAKRLCKYHIYFVEHSKCDQHLFEINKFDNVTDICLKLANMKPWESAVADSNAVVNAFLCGIYDDKKMPS